MIKCNKYFPVLLLALCVMGWMACTQQRQPCLTPKTASLIIETIHKQTDTSTVFVDSALPHAVFIAFTNDPNALPGRDYSLGSLFAISLSPDSSVCQWAFTADSLSAALNPGQFDTLTFYYRRNLQFLSNACGYTYFYSLDSAHTTHKIIDSLHIINTSVTNNVNTKHLQVYIHPDF